MQLGNFGNFLLIRISLGNSGKMLKFLPSPSLTSEKGTSNYSSVLYTFAVGFAASSSMDASSVEREGVGTSSTYATPVFALLL